MSASWKILQVAELSRRGIPEALRGEVWQLLSGCSDNTEMLELYKQLLPRVGADINFSVDFLMPVDDFVASTISMHVVSLTVAASTL